LWGLWRTVIQPGQDRSSATARIQDARRPRCVLRGSLHRPYFDQARKTYFRPSVEREIVETRTNIDFGTRQGVIVECHQRRRSPTYPKVHLRSPQLQVLQDDRLVCVASGEASESQFKRPCWHLPQGKSDRPREVQVHLVCRPLQST
jgi:hypothetical protein